MKQTSAASRRKPRFSNLGPTLVVFIFLGPFIGLLCNALLNHSSASVGSATKAVAFAPLALAFAYIVGGPIGTLVGLIHISCCALLVRFQSRLVVSVLTGSLVGALSGGIAIQLAALALNKPALSQFLPASVLAAALCGAASGSWFPVASADPNDA